MQLEYVSLTGADDDIDPTDLAVLSQEYPYAEWAILCMPIAAGTPRFPSIDWIYRFKKVAAEKKLHTAMHLCGEALVGFIDGQKEILDLMQGFSRVQLNLKFGNVDGTYDPARLVARVAETPDIQFIIQYGRDKKGLLPLLADVRNHAVLFDESAGRGISPDSWDAPLDGHFCGYAGGITPDNVEHNLEMIAKVAAGKTTWIDLESGIRTDDRFDLAKAKRVLSLSRPYTTAAA